jgi:hypothetical protein
LISPDKNKLRKVYDELGEALGVEPSFVTVEEKNMSHKENSLSNTDMLVFQCIKKHPGISKEKVVTKVKNRSRVPILRTIKSLADDGLIFDKEDENNKKRHHLFINTGNELAKLITKLDSFKESYFSLLDKTQSLEDKLVSNMSFYDKSKLIEALILPFKTVMSLTQYDIFGHREKTHNKDLIQKKTNTAFAMMQDIHLKLYKSRILKTLIEDSEEEILIQLFMNNSNGLSPRNIIEMTRIFNQIGMDESVDKVIDSLWDISYSILPFVDLHYSRNKYNAETIKNWRKVISEFEYDASKNKPYMSHPN